MDIAAAIEQGRYVSLDVAETLSTFMVNDRPDPARFLKAAGDLIATAAKASSGERIRIAACGECAPILWAQGKADAAIQLEQLWDEIARGMQHGYSLRVCIEQLSTRTGGPHLRENLRRTLRRLLPAERCISRAS